LATETDLLITQLERAFDRRSWHGPNLLGSIRGVSPEQAAWRPGSGRHNIWELIVHAAYWKYIVHRRLTGGKRGSFPLEGSNFFERPLEASIKALKSDAGLLRSVHKALIDEVKIFPTSLLGRLSPGGKYTFREMIIGVAAHDIYHAGQIQLLKRLQENE
jgi:uncharacterized damage-inducible protein DinB